MIIREDSQDATAGSLGFVGHNGQLHSHHRIQKRAFTHVRFSNERYISAFMVCVGHVLQRIIQCKGKRR